MSPPADRETEGLLGSPSQSPHVALLTAFDLIRLSAKLLFENGQTTERTIEAVARLGDSLGLRAELLPRWGELTIRIEGEDGTHYEIFAAVPAGVDMNRVACTMQVLNDLRAGTVTVEEAQSTLKAVSLLPPASTSRFALMAASGAASLGVIFGATHLLSLVLIAASAGAGGYLRRSLGKISHNPLVQPLFAAALAGIIGAIVAQLELSSILYLVAVCPCMVLVPGPHLLNGAIDLSRARVDLGAARIGYAGVIILLICIGLLAGLALGGETLPVQGPSSPVPLAYDVVAAGVAVAAYGTFFSMPWRTLPIPVLIGMLAHAVRWALLSMAGASVEVGALVACLLVGVLATPIADRLRMPFAAFAFASVVSLIPGVFLFRMASGLVNLIALGSKAPAALLPDTVADGATALLILLGIAFGLILPKLIIEHIMKDSSGPIS